MAKTIFEEMGETYTRQGDYELPDLALPDQDQVVTGIWGERYRRWLKENHRVLYYNLLTSGKLNEQIADVDARAEAMFSRLVSEMARNEGVTEHLKAIDTMAWVRRMNSIRKCAAQVVFADLFK